MYAENTAEGVFDPLKFNLPIQSAHVETQYIVPSSGAGAKGAFLLRTEKDLQVYDEQAFESNIIVLIGNLRVSPETEYRARYSLQLGEAASEPEVYLQILPKIGPDSPPITPYPREAVWQRKVSMDYVGEWMERNLVFETGEDTNFIELYLVVTNLAGELIVSELEIFKIPDEPEISKSMDELLGEIRQLAATRSPVTERPLVFSRSQFKYFESTNYLQNWLDRPLFAGGNVNLFTSVRRMFEQVRKYDLDGLAFFPQNYRRDRYFDISEQVLSEDGFEGLRLLPEFFPGETPESYAKVVARALASPITPRIDGKVLITSNIAEEYSPEEWAEILDYVRSEHGEQFLFLPALAARGGVSLARLYRQGMLSQSDLERVRSDLRAYLAVADGIYFYYPPALRLPERFPRTFDRHFYEEVFIPLWQSVLAEKGHEGKLLGLSAYRAHTNPDVHNAMQEDGTRTLRNSFEPAMAAGADVILLPEWDEQNENTSFRPTVYNSTALQRILRYYMSRIRDQDLTPLSNDDTAIPNLILSLRNTVVLGEDAVIELLNVPDSQEVGTYEVEITILDENLDVLRSYGPFVFQANELQEERIVIPTEDFPNARALLPVLSIINQEGVEMSFGEGLPFTMVRSTWNLNLLFMKQPLRDLLQPEAFFIDFKEDTTGKDRYWAEGYIQALQPLAHVELLADDNEIYAVDPENVFFRNDPDNALVHIDIRAIKTGTQLSGELSVQGSDFQWITQGFLASYNQGNNSIQFSSHAVDHNPRWLYLAIENPQEAQLHFDSDLLNWSLPISQLKQNGRVEFFECERGLRMAVSKYRKQIDLPEPLDSKEVSFEAPVWPDPILRLYHLRAIAHDGRIFRSWPQVLPVDSADGTHDDKVNVAVHSDQSNERIILEVESFRVPRIEYDFNPQLGGQLQSNAGPAFGASLGGFLPASTGRGLTTNYQRREYLGPTAPEWVEVDGQSVLYFNGKSNFLVFPQETLPRRAGFSIEMEVRPEGASDRYSLLKNRSFARAGGFFLYVENGLLHISFVGENHSLASVATQLQVPDDQWSTIRLDYDLETVHLSVNNMTETIPCYGPARDYSELLFGDGWRNTNDYFHGFLRSLIILHGSRK